MCFSIDTNSDHRGNIYNYYNDKMLTDSPLTLFSTFKETILNNDWNIIIPEEIFEKIFKFFCFLNLI